jgi:hypothetical protein
MSLYLHIPDSLDPATRVAAFNAAFGHPLPQVDRDGNPVPGIATTQLSDVPAANGDGVVLEVSSLYHQPPDAEDAIDGATLYSLRGAVAAGIVEHPRNEVGELETLDPDPRIIADAVPHQTEVFISQELADEAELDAVLVKVGKTKGDVEAVKDPVSGKVAIKGVAEEMPVAALDDGAKLIKSDTTKDWPKVDGTKDPKDPKPPKDDDK